MPLYVLLIALAVLLILSAFFSLSETSMMAINRYRLKHLAETGKSWCPFDYPASAQYRPASRRDTAGQQFVERRRRHTGGGDCLRCSLVTTIWHSFSVR